MVLTGVHEVALGERERSVINVDDGSALEHVEPLIRFLMDVRRRPTADWDNHDQERVAASCLDRRGEETNSTEHHVRLRCAVPVRSSKLSLGLVGASCT